VVVVAIGVLVLALMLITDVGAARRNALASPAPPSVLPTAGTAGQSLLGGEAPVTVVHL
jgi:hypothetical protein